MIVVLNPSSTNGHSFKGLNAYCSHDQGRAQTAERVDWIDSRNLATNDPDHAWRIMVATEKMQNELKAAHGIKPHTSKKGAVMHVVLSFDKDEPTDREAMAAAADEFLSHLGVDPAKMRAKNKPKRRQFADEHQVMMYAHSDTDHKHLHMMINLIHPETGVRLPSNNNQVKASDWALEYSQRHGTDQKTPARAENQAARKNGEYVKAEPRKSRNVYEFDQAVKTLANDNAKTPEIAAQQTSKDADLALRGRNLAQMQDVAMNKLAEGHRARKSALFRTLQQQINKIRAAVREEFRPRWRELRTFQAKERQTFEGLESTFFGRTSNIARSVKASFSDVQDGATKLISRSFRILTNAAERKAFFDAGQERARASLQAEERKTRDRRTQAAEKSHSAKLAVSRRTFLAERAYLKQHQAEERAELQALWRERNQERAEKLDQLKKAAAVVKDYALSAERPTLTDEQKKTAERLLKSYNATSRGDHEPANDNERDQDEFER